MHIGRVGLKTVSEILVTANLKGLFFHKSHDDVDFSLLRSHPQVRGLSPGFHEESVPSPNSRIDNGYHCDREHIPGMPCCGVNKRGIEEISHAACGVRNRKCSCDEARRKKRTWADSLPDEHTRNEITNRGRNPGYDRESRVSSPGQEHTQGTRRGLYHNGPTGSSFIAEQRDMHVRRWRIAWSLALAHKEAKRL